MSEAPIGYAIGPSFWARLALALPNPLDQLQWSRDGHDNEVGRDFVENWNELFEVPDKDPDVWRRAVFPARSPFLVPGWTMYDARLGADSVVELRRVEHIPVDV